MKVDTLSIRFLLYPKQIPLPNIEHIIDEQQLNADQLILNVD